MNDAITGIDGSFSLVDHNGRPVTERDFRGRYMLVYFGFTHCRMVCPRSLTRSSEALDALDPQLAKTFNHCMFRSIRNATRLR